MPDTDNTYNGWANYATWAVNMYLDGNYTGAGTYEAAVATARDAIEDTTANAITGESNARYDVAQALRQLVDDDLELEGTSSGLVADLFSYAFASVDWYELADAWIENVQEQAVEA